MEITEVRVYKEENGRLRGYADITLDDSFAVHAIRIIEGDNGLFIAMPSKKISEGIFTDICHPINQKTRDVFTKVILEEYNKLS